MAVGTFRPDLYDRLAFEVVTLPSLASRLEDIPILAVHFLARFRQEVAGILVKEISADALDLVLYEINLVENARRVG
jgi:psp operon transcriptional activator